MRDEKKTNRLFIGASVVAVWPDKFLSNEIIKEENRHFTILFFGGQDQDAKNILMNFPKPESILSPTGVFSNYVGLPKRSPHLVAMEGKIITGMNIEDYRNNISRWSEMQKIDFKKPKRPFYPHLTICRKHPDIFKWESSKIKIPFYIDGINLYQSLGKSEYERLKTYPLVPAFEQIHHTADIAFLIRGESLQSIFINAQIALAFTYPDILDFLKTDVEISSQDQIVMKLNKVISNIDIEVGCPFKAVSFHGSFTQQLGYTQWEMIVDV